MPQSRLCSIAHNFEIQINFLKLSRLNFKLFSTLVFFSGVYIDCLCIYVLLRKFQIVQQTNILCGCNSINSSCSYRGFDSILWILPPAIIRGEFSLFSWHFKFVSSLQVLTQVLEEVKEHMPEFSDRLVEGRYQTWDKKTRGNEMCELLEANKKRMKGKDEESWELFAYM